MNTPEIDNFTIPAMPDESHAATNSRYDAVRFNAITHGILSRHVVLAHEDVSEYQALLAALLEEHQPAGATEDHLA